MTEIGKSLIAEGIELGKREKAIEAAMKAILKDIDTETISDITDLSIHDIELIKTVINLK
ncbi:MAG: hypothetical protein ACRCXT_10250 [Paraclostridium sp.]